MSSKIKPQKSKNSRQRNIIMGMLGANTTKSSLDPNKFNILMSLSFGFEESLICFEDLTRKFAEVLECEACQLFLVNENEHHLYTYIRDDDDQETLAVKPLDRGLGSSVVTNETGVVLDNARANNAWDEKVDEMLDFQTKSYLGWPLTGAGGECIGLIEGRNKKDGESFDVSDQQIAQIFAHQVGSAVSQSKQQALLADRNDAFNKAYEKNFDKSEAISLTGGNKGQEAMNGANDSGYSGVEFAATALGTFHAETAQDLQNWNYDVFEKSIAELEMLFVDVFEDRGLFTRFSIDIKVFLKFTQEIIAGYSTETPYHNYFHGFDVMHVCYLFVSTCDADGYLEDFNILSLLVGAIAHDVGHDGLNNAFHAASMSELAITYNSISILENFSAAFLFRIMKKEGCDIFKRIPDPELKKLRTRLIDMILDTDAKNHFILMTRFKHGLEMKQLSRGLLSSMILHIADVSNPTRPGGISRKWAFAVQEEFFRQGDKEKALGMSVSPFMDRGYENLPRMQGAFIDALVSPVFHLTAEFLPKIKDNCIRSMQLNRAFWNNLQNKQVMTTSDIKKVLATDNVPEKLLSPERGEKKKLSASVGGEEKQEGENGNVDEVNSPQAPKTAIPGIPQNAPHSPNMARRKMSIIAMRDAKEEALALEMARSSSAQLDSGRDSSSHFPMTPQAKERQAKEKAKERMKRVAAILDGNYIQMLMLLCTAYALVADDLSLWMGDKANDFALSIITFLVLVLFTIELFVSVYCVPEYMQFFFWLDLIAALSLIPEIGWLVGEDEFNHEDNALEEHGTLTRAGRAAKAGARAGRLARVLRLIRLVRIMKLFKWMASIITKRIKANQGEVEESGEEVEMKMSNVGRKMTESITRKVILAVICMLLTFSLFEDLPTPDSRLVQLDDISAYPSMRAELVSSYILRYSAVTGENPSILLKLSGCGEAYDYVDVDRFDSLRNIEVEVVQATSNSSIFAYFDIKKETQNTAMHSFIMTVFVTVLLATLSMLFSKDAYNIMIRPIEKMKHTVQQLSENPLLHLEKLKNQKNIDSGESETDMLEQAITKMARLLQIGFGSAGAEIIANNLSDGGELNPMVPGSKVDAIFGFCDIREFTFATEGLQEDVMLFVNKIAEITHKYVVKSGGAPNKNIGDAFLLVWKLTDSARTGGDLKKDLYDSALYSFLRIIKEIRQMGNLSAFLDGADENAPWRSTLEDFKVYMGFGLHTGWAIEGSIGSQVKVDASYLSPHVNLASRLEAATKQFRVPLLMSEAFVKGLTGTTQSNCRRVDSVTFKGSSEPMHIFHYDAEPFDALVNAHEGLEELLAECAWTEDDVERLGIDLSDVGSLLASHKVALARQVYEMGFLAYMDGNWEKAKIILSMWLKAFPGDQVAHVLLERLRGKGFEAPEGWQGYHALTEK